MCALSASLDPGLLGGRDKIFSLLKTPQLLAEEFFRIRQNLRERLLVKSSHFPGEETDLEGSASQSVIIHYSQALGTVRICSWWVTSISFSSKVKITIFTLEV